MPRRGSERGQQFFNFEPQPSEPEDTPVFPIELSASTRQNLLFSDSLPAVSPYPVNHSDPSTLPITAPINLIGQTDRTNDASVNGHIAPGEKQKARDIIVAIRTLKTVEREQRAATAEEKQALSRFSGFGPVALTLFPDPITGKYKDGWKEIGEELRDLLTKEEYDSAKRTTFNAFYTSPVVMKAMHDALQRLGVRQDALALEPGCGTFNFAAYAPPSYQFIGVELDSISGRIAKARFPQHQIRIENFKNSVLPKFDAVIGNVPFANIQLEHNGKRFSLHDFFFAKSTDHLAPGGVLALVTSHFTLDKANASIREYLADRADFVGAIRLPSTAFKNEGTAVVTDIVFLRKRAPGQEPKHADPDWLKTEPMHIDGAEVSINKYFLNHPEQVLGTWSRADTLYGEGFSVVANGELADQLKEAIWRLAGTPIPNPQLNLSNSTPLEKQPNFTPPPPLKHLTEGSLFIGDDRLIRQIEDGQGVPLIYGGSQVWVSGAVTGRRLGQLIGLRDLSRRVLQSQNEGWPEETREEARKELNRAYDRFVFTFGPINKTTFHETKDGTTIRRMPNIARFRDDPDAMLVLALEEYDEEINTAKKAPIMFRDVVGKHEPISHVKSAEEGLLVSLDRKGGVDLAFISGLYGKPESQIIEELGDLIYHDPVTKQWQTADEYLSGNVREKLKQAEATGYTRNIEALKAVQPEDVLPGEIDANLGSPWIPETDIQAFAGELFGCDPKAFTISHVAKDAAWSVEANYSAKNSVASTTDYGTPRIDGISLFELGMNMKSPTIYDPDPSDPEGKRRIVNQDDTLAAREKQKQIKEKFKSWVFNDPDRAERLVRIYNDNFNNLRPRLFDGSHLKFPGMSQSIKLNPHQVDAIWRVMSSGNTLLAHAVGSGKSFEMAASAMKLKQLGLARRSIIEVPNNLLEQFAREFQQLYPNARLLVTTKDDVTPAKRRHFVAKVATGDWDAIIMTHTTAEKIGMSRKYQEEFLSEQIKEYEDLIIEHAAEKGNNKNILKTLEKQKAAHEEKLKELMAEDKKDCGLTFDELGVDHIFVDECFTYDTLIETNVGLLPIGDIVTQRRRVNIKTLNPITNALEWKPVINWFANKRRTQLIEVFHEHGSFICTPKRLYGKPRSP